ncbi:MAG: glycosyltransferase [Planctomycetes bacterium]|nr:glycosyltransferase [Planctomycetota bacterium]
MNVSGFTFVRNAIKYDFQVVESIRSILPIVDEFIVNVGNSEDNTLSLIHAIDDKKIRIIENTWDDLKRKNGDIFRKQTNLIFDACSGDWAFYLQADEVLHEEELPRIQMLMEENLDRPKVLVLIFRYFHFYGDYQTLNPWSYRKEIRVIRNNGKVLSISDAVGFYCIDDPVVKNLKDGSPERFVKTGCHIYHYGWVKNPRTMLEKKIFQMSKYLGMAEEYIRLLIGQGREVFESRGLKKSWDTVMGILKDEWSFYGYDFMKDFRGTHPKVMQERIHKFIPFFSRKLTRWVNPRFYSYILRHGFKG